MLVEKYNPQNESFIKKRIADLLYPTIFSLMMTLNGYAQNNQSPENLTSDPKTEIITDSVLLAYFENIFNQLTAQSLSDLQRKKLNTNIVQGLAFYFNESSDSANTISPEHLYMKRKNDKIPHKLQWFLDTFHKESYRSAGTLSVKIIALIKEGDKVMIEYDYVYTPKVD